MTISEINKSIPNTLLKCQFKLYNVNIILVIDDKSKNTSQYVDDMIKRSEDVNSMRELYFLVSSYRSKRMVYDRESILSLNLNGNLHIDTIVVQEIFELKDAQLFHLVDFAKITNCTIVGTGYLPERGTILYKLLIQHYPELVL